MRLCGHFVTVLLPTDLRQGDLHDFAHFRDFYPQPQRNFLFSKVKVGQMWKRTFP